MPPCVVRSKDVVLKTPKNGLSLLVNLRFYEVYGVGPAATWAVFLR